MYYFSFPISLPPPNPSKGIETMDNINSVLEKVSTFSVILGSIAIYFIGKKGYFVIICLGTPTQSSKK